MHAFMHVCRDLFKDHPQINDCPGSDDVLVELLVAERQACNVGAGAAPQGQLPEGIAALHGLRGPGLRFQIKGSSGDLSGNTDGSVNR